MIYADMRGSASPTDWCGTSLFTSAQGQLCRVDPQFCPGGRSGDCASISAAIQTNCGFFQNDGTSQTAVQIREAAQCIDGTWIGGCQGTIPCGGMPGGPSVLLLALGAALIGGGVALARLETQGRIF